MSSSRLIVAFVFSPPEVKNGLKSIQNQIGTGRYRYIRRAVSACNREAGLWLLSRAYIISLSIFITISLDLSLHSRCIRRTRIRYRRNLSLLDTSSAVERAPSLWYHTHKKCDVIMYRRNALYYNNIMHFVTDPRVTTTLRVVRT